MRRLGMIAAALALAACADDPAPEAAAPPPPPPAEPVRQMIDRVETLELGRTRSGFVLAAFGSAEGVGWRLAQLRPVTGVPGPEGYLEFEFVAIPPAGAAPGRQGLRADTPLAPEQLRGAAGVRVIARDGAVEGVF